MLRLQDSSRKSLNITIHSNDQNSMRLYYESDRKSEDETSLGVAPDQATETCRPT